jgi:Icc protein
MQATLLRECRPDSTEDSMVVIAHLSDTHLNGSPHAAERSERVLGYLNRLSRPIDVLLVTGDIADHGLAEEYAEAAQILVAEPPVLMLPGNHDVRGPFRQGLLGTPASDGPINQLQQVAGVAFLLCDSSIPGRDDGALDEETLEWISMTLAEVGPGMPTFICFHHPPVSIGIEYVDQIRLFDTDRLAAIIEANPQVVAVLCGHAHTAAASTFAGRPLLVAPGVTSTVTLPWEVERVVDYRPPPAVAFHILDDTGRLTTHYRPVT